MSKQSDQMKYVGSMQQAAYIRPVTFAEGRSTGLKAYEVKNGPDLQADGRQMSGYV